MASFWKIVCLLLCRSVVEKDVFRFTDTQNVFQVIPQNVTGASGVPAVYCTFHVKPNPLFYIDEDKIQVLSLSSFVTPTTELEQMISAFVSPVRGISVKTSKTNVPKFNSEKLWKLIGVNFRFELPKSNDSMSSTKPIITLKKFLQVQPLVDEYISRLNEYIISFLLSVQYSI